MLAAAGKRMGHLERKGLSREWMHPPEWGPWKWYARKNTAGEDLPKPLLVASWSEASGYVFPDAAVALLLPGTTPEQLRRELQQ